MTHAEAVQRGLMDIGRAAAGSGVSPKMIRHYEKIGLLPGVARTPANYRLYGPKDVDTLRFVRQARSLGFSMEDIKELLALCGHNRSSSAAARRIAGRHIAALRSKLAEARALAAVLERLARR